MKDLNTTYMLKVPEAMALFSRGRNRMIADAIQAGAYVKAGRSRLIIVDKMKRYYENLAK